MAIRYKRILLKLSGEALAGEQGFGLDMDTVQTICAGIKQAHDLGAQIAIVVGGGNFWRGRSSGEMERTRADQIGMLATAMNALAVADTLEQIGLEVRVQTALTMQQVAEPYIRNRAIRHLEKGRIVILACGTGNPFFSTDTASALRAAEIDAEIIFKATMVDGVYDKDPKKYDDAKKYDQLTFSRVLTDQLAVMDSTAATMCRDNKLPILVFDILHPENIAKAVAGETIGTLVTEE
jgi:uridylate kinase